MATWMLSLSTIYFNAVVGTGNTRFNMYIEIAAIALYLGYTFLVVKFLNSVYPGPGVLNLFIGSPYF